MRGLAAAVLVASIDQWTKGAIFARFGVPSTRELVTGLSISTGFNTGVAFGVGTGLPPWLLVAIGVAIAGWFLILMSKAQTAVHSIGFGAVIGGAAGNVIDRLRFHQVRDFIDVHAGHWHWPAFNFADSFIFVGVVLLLIPAGSGRFGRGPPATEPTISPDGLK